MKNKTSNLLLAQLFLVHALRITKWSFLNNRKSSDRKCNFFVFNRKFATGKPLESLVHGTFADVMCPAIDKEGGQPFDPYPKLTLLIYNLLSPMAFGKTWVVLGTSIWWYPAIYFSSAYWLWQSNRPASLSLARLTLWPNCLERWLATLSRLSTQVRIPVGFSVAPGVVTS